MKVGAEDKKKVKLLAALSAIALITVYFQFFSDAPQNGAGSPRVRRAAGPPTAQAQPARRVTAPTRRRVQGGGQAFQPVWVSLRDDESFNPLEADPTLRTDLLAAVRAVTFTNVDRNIFEFTTRRRVETPPSAAEIARATALQQSAERGAAAPQPVAPPTPQEPRAPRLSWRYYGFANADEGGQKRAFLLDGTDVLIGGEGDVFKNRYKIVRIGQTQIVIEDMQFSSEQELTLEAPAG
ncbi:MAG: hypothetical protein O3A53_00365 [Acidobacteria bacterium]|nr:hypothetical protein [Acidobacteriota bacterium]MDA1233233.1 hypothetical protein [Acidobacteriota bacterium]